MRILVLCTAFLFGLFAASAAAQTSCAPRLVASLAIHDRRPLGTFTVPVTINDQQREMYLSLSPHTSVARGFLGPESNEPFVRGHLMDHDRDAIVGKVASLQLGTARGTDLFVDLVGYQPDANGPVGTIGTGILANFDMELDFAAGKVNLYEHETCAGGGVQGMAHVAALPFDMEPLHKVSLPMTLDGKPVTVSMNLARLSNAMPVTSAVSLFALDTGPAPVARAQSVGGDNPSQAPAVDTDAQPPADEDSQSPASADVGALDLTHRDHRFARLSAGEFALDDLHVLLTGSASDPICDGRTRHYMHAGDAYTICFGGGDLELGLTTLRRLHLYFAFKERKLYVAPANP